MRFIRSATTTMIFKGAALLSSLVVSIIVGRSLGPEGRGVYGILMTVLALATGFGVFGFSSANTYYIARDGSKARAAGTQSILIGLVGSAVTGLILFTISGHRPEVISGLDRGLLWMTIALLPLFLCGSLFSQAFLGLGNVVAFNVFHAGQRFAFFAMALLMLTLSHYTLHHYIFSVLLSLLLSMLLYVIWYYRAAPPGGIFDFKLFTNSLSYGCRSYVATVLTTAVMRAGIFFVNYFRGNSEAGMYSVAQQLSEILVIFPSVVGGILIPRVARGDSGNLTARVIRTMNVIFLPLALLLVVAARPIIGALFGAEFLPSATALMIFVPGAYLLGAEVIMAGHISGSGYPWPAALIWIPLFVINCIGYLILVPPYGVNGAAFSTSLSFLSITVLMAIYLREKYGFKFADFLWPRREDFLIIFSAFKEFLRGGIGKAEAKTSPGHLLESIDGSKPHEQYTLFR